MSSVLWPAKVMADSCPVESASPLKKLHQFNPRDVASELSILDAEMIRQIGPGELEGGAWMKKDKVYETTAVGHSTWYSWPGPLSVR